MVIWICRNVCFHSLICESFLLLHDATFKKRKTSFYITKNHSLLFRAATSVTSHSKIQSLTHIKSITKEAWIFSSRCLPSHPNTLFTRRTRWLLTVLTILFHTHASLTTALLQLTRWHLVGLDLYLISLFFIRLNIICVLLYEFWY